MLQKVGIITLFIGAMMADSECLWIPFGIVLLGAFLIRIGTRREDNDETA